jgi:hypothetical protein
VSSKTCTDTHHATNQLYTVAAVGTACRLH